MAIDYKASTINDLTQLYRSGEATPSQVLEAYIKRIERDEARVGAFITTTFDEAREIAHRLDKRLADAPETIDWDKETLFGVPVALKDNMCTQGVKTTCASKILGDFRPPYDGTAPGRLRAHGAVFVGKTNLDEFAMGSSCENSAFMRTTNPHFLTSMSLRWAHLVKIRLSCAPLIRIMPTMYQGALLVVVLPV